MQDYSSVIPNVRCDDSRGSSLETAGSTILRTEWSYNEVNVCEYKGHGRPADSLPISLIVQGLLIASASDCSILQHSDLLQ